MNAQFGMRNAEKRISDFGMQNSGFRTQIVIEYPVSRIKHPVSSPLYPKLAQAEQIYIELPVDVVAVPHVDLVHYATLK